MSRFYRITRVVTPAPSLALITLDQAKTALGIPLDDNSHDAAIEQHIAAVSAAVNNYCNRVFAVQTYRDQYRYVEKWRGLSDPLLVRQLPFVIDPSGKPLVAVTEDDVVLEPEQYEADPAIGAVYRLDGKAVVDWGGRTIVIDYTAGFDPVPADVQAGSLEWMRGNWFAAERGDPAVRSETAVDVASFSYFDWAGGGSGSSSGGSAVPPNAATLLGPYRLISL